MQVTRARFEVGVLYAAGALIPVVMMRMIGAEIHHWHLLMCSAFALCCVSLSTLLGAKTNRPISQAMALVSLCYGLFFRCCYDCEIIRSIQVILVPFRH